MSATESLNTKSVLTLTRRAMHESGKAEAPEYEAPAIEAVMVEEHIAREVACSGKIFPPFPD
jgi:hypothetical protein